MVCWCRPYNFKFFNGYLPHFTWSILWILCPVWSAPLSISAKLHSLSDCRSKHYHTFVSFICEIWGSIERICCCFLPVWFLWSLVRSRYRMFWILIFLSIMSIDFYSLGNWCLHLMQILIISEYSQSIQWLVCIFKKNKYFETRSINIWNHTFCFFF